MSSVRAGHAATVLANGHVLVSGGGSPYATAEVYDPGVGRWTMTGALNHARTGPTATLLASGTVLVAGGQSWPTTLSSAEVYDPASATWSVGEVLLRLPRLARG